VTTSRIMDSAQFKKDAPPNLKTQLWKFPVQPADANPVR